jgi:hypothetical protein
MSPKNENDRTRVERSKSYRMTLIPVSARPTTLWGKQTRSGR